MKHAIKNYTITLYGKKGAKLPESFNVEFDGLVGTRFKVHYLNFARMFVNPLAHSIEVTG